MIARAQQSMTWNRGVLLGLLATLGVLGGCATNPASGNMRVVAAEPREHAGSAGGVSEPAELFAAFLACSSPACFIEMQQGVDMTSWVESLDDWSAVRLGALGPLRSGARVLNRKRASFLVTASEQYGLARAEVFALFILHSSFDDDLREVLALLAADRLLSRTLGSMPAVREALLRRSISLADFPERPEGLRDVARGLAGAATDALSSSQLSRGAIALNYFAQRNHLPPPYQKVLVALEHAQFEQAFSASNLSLGCLDEMTLGIPLGLYNLVAGTSHGVYSLSQGQYEQATRELAASTVLVALFAGGKGVRALSRSQATPLPAPARGLLLKMPELGIPELEQDARALWDRLGPQGLSELARSIQANHEAALFVYDGGEPAALALREAHGDLARAQAWLSEARQTPPGGPPGMSAAGNSGLGLAALVDESTGHSRMVVEARLVQAELEVSSPRLSADVAVLERQRPVLEAPPLGAGGHPLWAEYVTYWEERLVDLKQGKAVKPPLSWEGYVLMRGLFARGVFFERRMVALLREDALLPPMKRRWLKDFIQPRVEANVGVSKPGLQGVRYADVLVIEERPPPGQPPRVETFSFKSRDFTAFKVDPLKEQIRQDAGDALRYYGGMLDIRRPSLKLRGNQVAVQRIRLVYEGGKLNAANIETLLEAVRQAGQKVQGVEVQVE